MAVGTHGGKNPMLFLCIPKPLFLQQQHLQHSTLSPYGILFRLAAQNWNLYKQIESIPLYVQKPLNWIWSWKLSSLWSLLLVEKKMKGSVKKFKNLTMLFWNILTYVIYSSNEHLSFSELTQSLGIHTNLWAPSYSAQLSTSRKMYAFIIALDSRISNWF